MSITSMPDGTFEATVVFGQPPARHVRYSTREEAQELIDAERIYKMLGDKGTRDRCSDVQIIAAADTIANVPSDGSIDVSKWMTVVEQQLRSRVKAKPAAK
jgi:hypothetical protein